MSVPTRDELRSFLRLGARADKDGIPEADVERQEATVLRALAMLEASPGVVLADEVGMGKTFEALGVAAAIHHKKGRKPRIVVITPGPDLNRKWQAEFSKFRESYDFGEVVAVRKLREFLPAVRENQVVVAPVTMFQSGRGWFGRAYLLSLYFYWKELHGNTANAILARIGGGELERIDVETERFLRTYPLDEVWPDLKYAFCKKERTGYPGLDDLFEEGGLSAFEDSRAVKRALYRARFVLAGRLMPLVDLLVVDEAHKLKNPGSLRTRAMRQVFKNRFRKAAFLTATPFQLDVQELREIFKLFGAAKGESPKKLAERVDDLLQAISEYQDHYDQFQRAWSALDPVIAAEFARAYDSGDPDELEKLDDASIAAVTAMIGKLRELKEQVIEPGFREWMIRSIHKEKRTYRNHLPEQVRPGGAAALPFLLYERFIAELFRRRRQTHKAAVEINMASSYAAARQGAILADETGDIPAEAAEYGQLLRDVLSEMGAADRQHPKLDRVIEDAIDAADRGDKTLVFCSRIATLEQLRRELDAIWEKRVLARWREVYPDASATDIFDLRDVDERRHRGRHSLLQARFHRGQDALYLALREPYLRTLVPIADWALSRERLPAIARAANARLSSLRVGKTSAERLDYQVAKRCVEQAAVELWVAEGKPRAACAGEPVDDRALANLRSEEFLQLGLDLELDDYEGDPVGDAAPRWEISERVARLVLGQSGSLWDEVGPILDPLDLPLRVRVVEQLARYLTYKQVPFVVDVLRAAKDAGLSVDTVESGPLLAHMPQFWQGQFGRPWLEQIRAFLRYFVQRDPHQQLDILDGPIKTGDFVRHTRDGESREKLREAFNTPLFPVILLANEVMQEGLDLHKHCRRIVHHDLAWNPAQIEQRIGRIDRLGSLTNRLRKNGEEVTLDVLYPLIHGTIDQRLYRVVKTREKWLEFLLGAPPDFDSYSFDEDVPPPLPERLGEELAIDLGPSPT